MVKESLYAIKDTLSEAMDSIRNSVHDLHEESIDLHIEIQKLLDNYTYCPVKLEYQVDSNPEKDIKYCFIAVIKEALSNIMKHSDATSAVVSIRGHPALYQVVIMDNGITCRAKWNKREKDLGDRITIQNSGNGIGLKNMADRVNVLGGNVNISCQNGFRIFISIPKKG